MAFSLQMLPPLALSDQSLFEKSLRGEALSLTHPIALSGGGEEVAGASIGENSF